MAKTETIIIRVSSEEKQKALFLTKFLNKKNISTLFRDYILDLNNFIDEIKLTSDTPEGISLDDLIENYESQLELVKISKKNPYHVFDLRRKINLLNEIKKDYSK